MYKNLLTNPITGKIIQKTNITPISIITHNFFSKPINTKKVIKKPKVKIVLYFFLNLFFEILLYFQ